MERWRDGEMINSSREATREKNTRLATNSYNTHKMFDFQQIIPMINTFAQQIFRSIRRLSISPSLCLSLPLSLFFLMGVMSVDAKAQTTEPPVYITLWFDTEDFILPQSDDAAKRVAEILTRLGVKGTFKVVGE